MVCGILGPALTPSGPSLETEREGSTAPQPRAVLPRRTDLEPPISIVVSQAKGLIAQARAALSPAKTSAQHQARTAASPAKTSATPHQHQARTAASPVRPTASATRDLAVCLAAFRPLARLGGSVEHRAAFPPRVHSAGSGVAATRSAVAVTSVVAAMAAGDSPLPLSYGRGSE